MSSLKTLIRKLKLLTSMMMSWMLMELVSDHGMKNIQTMMKTTPKQSRMLKMEVYLGIAVPG